MNKDTKIAQEQFLPVKQLINWGYARLREHPELRNSVQNNLNYFLELIIYHCEEIKKSGANLSGEMYYPGVEKETKR